MTSSILAMWLLAALPTSDSAAAGVHADSAAPVPVRRFPPIEVRAPLHDLRSSQTVHVINRGALRSFPVDGLADIVALQAGVIAQGEELHVRGGRAGETFVSLEGLALNEPLRHRPLELPLPALAGADLVTGAPDARHAGSLAGVLDLRTLDPEARPGLEWRWQSDRAMDGRFDRVSARAGTPLRVGGLGVVAAADVTLDDTWMPALRSGDRRDLAGISMKWRAENRLLAWAKLAPVASPGRFSVQAAAGRQLHRPYDPAWSLDGWVFIPVDPKSAPVFSPVPLPGYQRWRAADHLAVTDDAQLATLVSLASPKGPRRASLRLGWLRTRTVRSPDGRRHPGADPHRPSYDEYVSPDPFHVLWGEDPLDRESGSDVYLLRGDAEATRADGGAIRGGAGVTYEDVFLDENEWLPLGWVAEGYGNTIPLESHRSYHAYAPGGFGYAQGRWLYEGMVMNAGLRAEAFTAGPQAHRQTLPGNGRASVTLSPRFGLAFPISTRDVFSLAYARLYQPPARDYLYDRRVTITNRQPLGNPALEPAASISYEAAVKHLFDASWALQASVFYREIGGQVGARDYTLPNGPTQLVYTNEDGGNGAGFELGVFGADGERLRLEAHYTLLQAWGTESRPEGDPYGTLAGDRAVPASETPLSWDRRHTLLVSGAWRWRERVTLAWSTMVGSPLPWTPKPVRREFTDFASVNSRRLDWTENTNLAASWSPPRLRRVTFGIEARNLFDTRSDRLATVDGYPNPVINTLFDDYGAYRTDTGLGGGAYLSYGGGDGIGRWVPVHDERLRNPPRTLRASVGARW